MDHTDHKRQNTSKDTQKKRERFSKRKALYISSHTVEPLNSFAQETSKKSQKVSEDSLELEAQTIFKRSNTRKMMKLNRSRPRTPLGQQSKNKNKNLFALSRDGVTVDEKTKRYIRNNFEERIQNETVLKAFIDRLVLDRK